MTSSRQQAQVKPLRLRRPDRRLVNRLAWHRAGGSLDAFSRERAALLRGASRVLARGGNPQNFIVSAYRKAKIGLKDNFLPTPR